MLSRNIAFTLLIKIKGRLREFNFRKRGDSLYDTVTSDEKGHRYFLKMENQEGSWKINGAQLPAWLVERERLIHTAIVKETQ